MACVPKQLKYYKNKTVMPFDEDATHEFKGHDNLCEEALPPWTQVPNQRTRGRISKSLNAFLNSGSEATVYLGILDDGVVTGLPLTAFKKEHITLGLDDLFGRYNPPVEKSHYSIEFIPVVGESDRDDEILKAFKYDPWKDVDESQKGKKHELRKYSCWCHKDFNARCNVGSIPPSYVVEIHIAAWDYNNPSNTEVVGQMSPPPIYEDECGEVYIRQQSSCHKVDKRDIYEIVRQNVNIYYTNYIKRLKEEREQLRMFVTQKHHNT